MLQPATLAFGAELPYAARIRSRSSVTARRLVRGRGHMSFLRHRKIYSDVPRSFRWDRQPIPASHRNEFSAGYSLASCTPALLAAALPASLILNHSTRFVDIISTNGKPSPFGLYQPRG